MENMKMIKCIKCGADMPELRLTKFGYKVCVNCSTTSAYRAVSTVNGTGDHTWNDIQIVTAEQAKQLDSQKKPKLLDSYSSAK
jgi:ribosomal protein L40E|tara:strand:- start:2372 stop:2620 length:249 start_codon:yes stop_codon:yes gene_type:complete